MSVVCVVTKKMELTETILVIIIFLTLLSVTIQERRKNHYSFCGFLSGVHCIPLRTIYTERIVSTATPPRSIHGVVKSADLDGYAHPLLAAYVAHHVLAGGLDHVLFGRPTDVRHQCRDLEVRISCRTRFRDVAVRAQLNEDAVHFDNVMIRLLGQRCHESLVAVDAFMSSNPGTLP